MPKNWTRIAEASGVSLPTDPHPFSALEAIEAAFRPLAASLPFTTEPAVILSETAVVGD